MTKGSNCCAHEHCQINPQYENSLMPEISKLFYIVEDDAMKDYTDIFVYLDELFHQGMLALKVTAHPTITIFYKSTYC